MDYFLERMKGEKKGEEGQILGCNKNTDKSATQCSLIDKNLVWEVI